MSVSKRLNLTTALRGIGTLNGPQGAYRATRGGIADLDHSRHDDDRTEGK